MTIWLEYLRLFQIVATQDFSVEIDLFELEENSAMLVYGHKFHFGIENQMLQKGK